ncbi:MAG: hypothetical protein Q7R93_02220 [bacterium]|nr:hypothetical protein [bacterium]
MSEERTFEKRLRREIEALLVQAEFKEANVFVFETEPANVMIQVIYPWGYLDEAVIAERKVTIFRLVEDFCFDKLGCNFSGGVFATRTYLRAWIHKTPIAQRRLDKLPDSFSV